MKPVFVVMGVTASGKSTIGAELAKNLNLPFHDADDYHSHSNKEKMKNGIPLTDIDREPWLRTLSEEISKWKSSREGGILACSALKRKYRDILREHDKDLLLIYLQASRELIAERLEQRKGHFMNKSLLDSQFEALEEPTESEHPIIVSLDHKTPTELVAEITKFLNELGVST